MIEEASGNLLEADVDALVNTVNTVGIMGKGIALQFKRAFPDNFRHYEKACKNNELRLGRVFVHEVEAITGPRYIVNFPTKSHWKSKSRLEDIESGLLDLRNTIQALGIKSIAVPPLGCGNGGLDWREVYPLIRRVLGQLEDVKILVYPPAGAPSATSMPIRTKRPSMTSRRASFLLALERYSCRSVANGLSETSELSLVEAQKVAYFLQLAGDRTQWDFAPSYYGPYARAVDQFISSVEGHFVSGYGDGSSGSRATLSLDKRALSEAHGLLDRDENYQATLQRFEDIVDGFEFPYGIELLSTVHFVIAQSDEPPSVREVVDAIGAWSKRKGLLFKERQASIAYRHLIDVGLVKSPALV